jgi:hypothetical protein
MISLKEAQVEAIGEKFAGNSSQLQAALLSPRELAIKVWELHDKRLAFLYQSAMSAWRASAEPRSVQRRGKNGSVEFYTETQRGQTRYLSLASRISRERMLGKLAHVKLREEWAERDAAAGRSPEVMTDEQRILAPITEQSPSPEESPAERRDDSEVTSPFSLPDITRSGDGHHQVTEVIFESSRSSSREPIEPPKGVLAREEAILEELPPGGEGHGVAKVFDESTCVDRLGVVLDGWKRKTEIFDPVRASSCARRSREAGGLETMKTRSTVGASAGAACPLGGRFWARNRSGCEP